MAGTTGSDVLVAVSGLNRVTAVSGGADFSLAPRVSYRSTP